MESYARRVRDTPHIFLRSTCFSSCRCCQLPILHHVQSNVFCELPKTQYICVSRSSHEPCHIFGCFLFVHSTLLFGALALFGGTWRMAQWQGCEGARGTISGLLPGSESEVWCVFANNAHCDFAMYIRALVGFRCSLIMDSGPPAKLDVFGTQVTHQG